MDPTAAGAKQATLFSASKSFSRNKVIQQLSSWVAYGQPCPFPGPGCLIYKEGMRVGFPSAPSRSFWDSEGGSFISRIPGNHDLDWGRFFPTNFIHSDTDGVHTDWGVVFQTGPTQLDNKPQLLGGVGGGLHSHEALLTCWCATAWIWNLTHGLTRWGENKGLGSPESPIIPYEGEKGPFNQGISEGKNRRWFVIFHPLIGKLSQLPSSILLSC